MKTVIPRYKSVKVTRNTTNTFATKTQFQQIFILLYILINILKSTYLK